MKRKVIALTGKIGSGKSAVCKILTELGFNTINCDDLSKQVATNPDVVTRVEHLLGSCSVSDGRLNRKAIREVVFSDVNLLRQYQQIFFDGVKELLVANIQALSTTSTVQQAAIFVEIAVLDAFPFAWDEVWRVECSQQHSIARVTARDGVSADSVYSTLGVQQVYDCTRVIVNNGNLDELRQAVERALRDARLI